jgi:formylglycine-generating enzyme required for sulfatase activity
MRTSNLILATIVVICFSGTAFSQDKKSFKPFSQIIPGTSVEIEMVPIPGGTFIMGSPENEPDRKPDEGPQRKVEIDPFWMGKFEITWEQYEQFMDKNKIALPSSNDKELAKKHKVDAITRPSPPYEDPSYNMGKGPDLPAVSMSQYAALTFCKWLSTVTGEFYRLPTEAEWEYACRAGSKTAYSFGNDVKKLDDYGWHYENSDGKYQKVGTKKPNAWGLYDMHGNVAEWTLDHYFPDFYSRHTNEPVKNPWATPIALEPRTVRGGSYDDDPDMLRSAARLPSDPNRWKARDPQIPKSFWWNTDSPFVGFRIVKPAKKMTPEEIAAFWSANLDD